MNEVEAEQATNTVAKKFKLDQIFIGEDTVATARHSS